MPFRSVLPVIGVDPDHESPDFKTLSGNRTGPNNCGLALAALHVGTVSAEPAAGELSQNDKIVFDYEEVRQSAAF